MEERFSPPEPAASLRSGVAARFRRLYWWAASVAWWVETPTAAAYLEVSAQLNDVQLRLLATETLLAVRTAERDAAVASVTGLAGVVARDQERVRAESAIAAAKREQAVNAAAESRGVRGSE